MRLTIVTATFNRASLLSRLFQSIASQPLNHHQIDWLIVDDGSSDQTAEVVGRFVLPAAITLSYVKVPHGGKHRALNEGFKRATGDWVLIIDSDDWVNQGGLLKACLAIEQGQALGALHIQLPLTVPKASRQYCFVKPNRLLSFSERIAQEPLFDSSFIFSQALMSLRFPTFEGEYFLAESALLFQLKNNQMLYISNAIAVSAEYQPDGLSAKMLTNRIQSSVGCMHVYKQQLVTNIPLKWRLRSLVNFGRLWWHSVLRVKKPTTPKGALQWLVLFVAWPITLYDRYSENRFPNIDRCK